MLCDKYRFCSVTTAWLFSHDIVICDLKMLLISLEELVSNVIDHNMIQLVWILYKILNNFQFVVEINAIIPETDDQRPDQ